MSNDDSKAFRVALVNMPFANLALPSIALTQLKSVLESTFGSHISIEIFYLNHDFVRYLDLDFYAFLSDSMDSLNSGLGDWFFRHTAFPELPDNSEKYFNRYFPRYYPGTQQLRELLLQKRHGVDRFMEELIAKYSLDQADLIGFTSMFMQNTASFSMAKKLKRRNPALITIMGGANCEFPMGGVIAREVKDIDYVFSGPALKSFPQFVSLCMSREMWKASSIPGVFHHGMPMPETATPITVGEELTIDAHVELDYTSFISRMGEYFTDRKISPTLTLETSRGCWWGQRAHCTFCGLNSASMTYRAMKPNLAIDLFNSLFQYSGTVVHLMAVDNILPKQYVAEVLPKLNTPSNMDIFYEVKADLSEEEIATLARARVKHIQPGIEALATSTLKLMRKGTTAYQNVRFLKLCALYGLEPNWNLLVGFPGEGDDVYRRYIKVIPLLLHLFPPAGAFPVRFDRFSPYFNQPAQYGLDLRPLDFYPLIYPFKKEALENLAYYFMDQNTESNEPQYFTTMVEWIDKLRVVVNQWLAAWKDRPNPPRLFLHQNDAVYDSRSGSVVEHRVGEIGKLLLEHLEKPVRQADLQNVLPEIDVQKEIAKLQEKDLLFVEDDRLLSLVLDPNHKNRASIADLDRS
ncbi:MAG TPA: RiPP maturation radical SAM C-methyltransferase [Candidatus Angelobacter sp.]|nr:RiPP maturation radical SAM C-methyltransferase [Candidatus Angelobacter sp.]